MTELELYRFIKENEIEYHLYKDGVETNDITQWNEEDYRIWKFYLYIDFNNLNEFTDLLDYEFFDDPFSECFLRENYLAIQIDDILDYYGINPINIFK